MALRDLNIINICLLYQDTQLEFSFLLCFPIANVSEKDCMHHMVNKTKGIITLYRHQRAAFAITSKRGPAPKLPKTSPNDLPPGSSISTETDEVGDI